MGKSMEQEVSLSKEMSMSSHRGGHLYMQTNEVKNAIIHYHRSANGTLTEVERVATARAGSGTFTQNCGQERDLSAFNGDLTTLYTPDSPCNTRTYSR